MVTDKIKEVLIDALRDAILFAGKESELSFSFVRYDSTRLKGNIAIVDDDGEFVYE